MNFLRHGPMLEKPYQQTIAPNLIIKDPKRAMKIYMNQDVEPPGYFLPDILSSAEGDIPLATDEQEPLDTALIDYKKQINFYQVALNRIQPLQALYAMSDHEISVMADTMGNYLYYCAASRLLLPEPQTHPFYERLFSVLKDQGFPCGWVGGEDWKTGDFLIFSR